MKYSKFPYRSLLVTLSMTASLLPALLAAGPIRPLNVSNPVLSQRPSYAPDQVLVKFRSGTSFLLQQRAIGGLGLHTLESRPVAGAIQAVNLSGSMSVNEAVNRFSNMPEVEYAQPNYFYYPSATTPNDPLYSQQWGLRNNAQAINNGLTAINNPPPAGGSDMDLSSAWDIRTDCSSVVVAVIDSGINRTHQDLANNMWTNAADPIDGADNDGNGYIDDFYGWDFVGNDNQALDLIGQDNDPLPSDGSGHGTHVAGTIGAQGNNNRAGSGVCWGTQIMAIRALSDTSGSTATIVPAIDYAVANGAKVINMSFGGDGLDPAMTTAIANARQQGVLVIAAAGNGGLDGVGDNNDQTPQYPCNLSTSQNNVICVAALDQAYGLGSFSNYGASSVNVGAPGVNILSSWPAPANELFDGSWTFANGGGTGWARANCPVFSDTAIPPNPLSLTALINPANWCANPGAAAYDNNQTDRVYKGLDLSLSGEVHLELVIYHDYAAGDALTVGFDTGAGSNPFDGNNDSVAEQLTGNTGGSLVGRNYTLNNCNVSNCGIGLEFTSGVLGPGTGTSIIGYAINAVETNSVGTRVIQGTSMATPHVTGLAALILAHNPNYSYLNAIDAIENSGDPAASLTGKTTSGRAVDAYQSLLHVTAPTGLSVGSVVFN